MNLSKFTVTLNQLFKKVSNKFFENKTELRLFDSISFSLTYKFGEIASVN